MTRQTEILSRRDFDRCLESLDGDLQDQLKGELCEWEGGDTTSQIELTTDRLGRIDSESSPRPFSGYETKLFGAPYSVTGESGGRTDSLLGALEIAEKHLLTDSQRLDVFDAAGDLVARYEWVDGAIEVIEI